MTKGMLTITFHGPNNEIRETISVCTQVADFAGAVRDMSSKLNLTPEEVERFILLMTARPINKQAC